jgi:Holliday junction resolvase
MSSYGKRKGATFETSVVKFLRSVGFTSERLTKAGAKDEGDIVVYVGNEPIVLELKATKSLALPQFWREATIEAEHFAKARGLKEVPLKYVIVKRRQAGIDKAWVIEDLEQWTKRNSK